MDLFLPRIIRRRRSASLQHKKEPSPIVLPIVLPDCAFHLSPSTKSLIITSFILKRAQAFWSEHKPDNLAPMQEDRQLINFG
jgi:hypothetical protein